MLCIFYTSPKTVLDYENLYSVIEDTFRVYTVIIGFIEETTLMLHIHAELNWNDLNQF